MSKSNFCMILFYLDILGLLTSVIYTNASASSLLTKEKNDNHCRLFTDPSKGGTSMAP